MTREQIFPSPQALSLTRKPKNQRVFNIAQLVLRVLVPSFTLAATIETLKSDQTVQTPFGISFSASYTYSAAMRYQLITNIVVGVSCLLSLMFLYLFTRPNWNINNYFYIFLYDLVLLLLITSACTAGTSIGMIARNGESKIGWGPICAQVPAFCHKVKSAIVFSYFALFGMAILTIMAASKLRRNRKAKAQTVLLAFCKDNLAAREQQEQKFIWCHDGSVPFVEGGSEDCSNDLPIEMKKTLFVEASTATGPLIYANFGQTTKLSALQGKLQRSLRIDPV
ncbi:hypothetical protein POM88_015952 [Heracleum sosnowskyi]|uniref:CASP-like protein n=1 Tax=Heracleum sosnowskyi TaxID=360622 RepID=A0AAD8IKT3_9APIA|nr:hypothetical protein POM88_015952 [Heracleum sosnowskyi]